ncbi:MAG: hypothetical protein HKP58_01670 [Desulfatitalea sp.]|nr:hypothetical protein [Desulfatitalea sp.]NNJ99096.1 hypothetical protein [Desulfatitalea sp.]
MEAAAKICRLMGILLIFLPMAVHADRTSGPDLDPMKAGLKDTVTFRDKFYAAATVGNQVWMVGYFGTILHFDGDAARFQKQESHTRLPLFGVSFTDEKIGYIVGMQGIVLKTIDGGRTWTKMKPAGEANLFAVQFIDAQKGWAVGDFGTIVHTNDGGRIWEKQSLDDTDINFNGCHFMDADRGVVVGEFEGIYRTEDGGASWRPANDPDYAGISLFNVAFKTDHDGMAVGQNGVLFQTWDGGRSWQRKQLERHDNLLNVGVIDNRYYIVGLRGLMLEESFPGKFLENNNSDATDWFYCIGEMEDGSAIAAGDHGRILWSSGRHSRREWTILN